MSKRDRLAWIGLIILTVAGMIVAIILKMPSASEVQAVVRPLPPLQKAGLSHPTLKELETRDVNGTIPVLPVPANPPRTDPFA